MQDAQTSPIKFVLAPKPLAASPTKQKDSTSGEAADNSEEDKVATKAQSTEAPVKRKRAKKPTPAKASGGVKKVTAPAKKKITPKKAPAKSPAKDEYVVERILDSRVSTAAGAKPTKEYLIRWEGYTSSHDTWEPESNLSAGLLKTYAAQKKAKKPVTPKAKSPAPSKKTPASAAKKSPAAAAAKTVPGPVKPAAKGAKKLAVVKTGITKASARKSLGSSKAEAAAAKTPKAKSPAIKKKAAAKPATEPKKPKLPADVFVVESILGHRNRTDEAGKVLAEYLIRWEGYDSSHDSWEPAKNLSKGMIKSYTASVAQPEEEAPAE